MRASDPSYREIIASSRAGPSYREIIATSRAGPSYREIIASSEAGYVQDERYVAGAGMRASDPSYREIIATSELLPPTEKSILHHLQAGRAEITGS